jgi:OLD-like protein
MLVIAHEDMARAGRWCETGTMDPESRVRRVVAVEGVSDRSALATLAARTGRDLDAEGVVVVAMGGATNIGHFLDQYGPRGLDVAVAGLCDEGEQGDFRRALGRAGLGTDLEQQGFFVCVADLEDELIRSLGVAAAEEVIATQGESRRYSTFLKQPAQQGRSSTQQLRRFVGTHSGAKARYARAFSEAVELDRVPRPLDRLLAWI